MDRIFRLLLVDDEPHVTGALSLQLEAREDLDVYVSNSAAGALDVLRRTRIDLMVSDIRMPGMTGLELLNRAQKEQPDCKVILLTGYADFNYVYEAMRQGASGYVLKNESDETLMEQIDKALSEIRKEKQTRRLLNTVLAEEKQEPKGMVSVRQAASLPEPREGQNGTLLYLTGGRELPPGLLKLIPRYFQEELEDWELLRSESGAVFHRLVWKQARPLSWHSSVLERLQGALAESGVKLSILLSPLPDDARALPETLRRMEEVCAALKADGAEEPFIYTLTQPLEQSTNPYKQLQSYIRSHLKDDLSLTQLGNITGYNGDYLNRMFRRETGEPIGHYIAACKLERLRSLLRDPDTTIERAAQEVGFTSRSYFNRFVRRETGMSPNLFRETLLKERLPENQAPAVETPHSFDAEESCMTANHLENPCPVCGMTHDCAIERVLLGKEAIEQIPGLLKDHPGVLIVWDGNTRPLCADRLIPALDAAGISWKEAFFDQTEVVIPDETSLEKIQRQLDGTVKALVGVGSGVINDLCKQVSFANGLPYMIVTTAPSMDGYASKGAALVLKGMKATLNAAVPRWIVADTTIIATAPMEMIQSGIGDILGKPSSLSDWKLGALLNGEPFCETVYRLTMEQVEAVRAHIDGCLARREESLTVLMNALIQVGINMSYMGNSRPASGSEHHLAHFFEITGILRGQPYLAHGIDVVYASVVTAKLRQRLLTLSPEKFHYAFDPAHYEAAIRQEYGTLSGEILALQQKVGFYQKNRVEQIRENWPEICQILREASDAQGQLELIRRTGLDPQAFLDFYGRDKILEAVRFARDLKDRYTALWLMNDVQAQEECVTEELLRF